MDARTAACETWANPAGALIDRVWYRVGQFGRALLPWVPPRDRALAAAVLSAEQLAAFRQMAAADQRHAVRVLRLLIREGQSDADLAIAALLHDLGKVDAGGHGRARMPHRVAKVLLAHSWPDLWNWLSARPRWGPLQGCYLLRYHPSLGAAWSVHLDVPLRACALIAAHQEDSASEDLAEALRQLRWADDRA